MKRISTAFVAIGNDVTEAESMERYTQTMFLFRFLLFCPWARLGLWILRIVWPNHTQDKP